MRSYKTEAEAIMAGTATEYATVSRNAPTIIQICNNGYVFSHTRFIIKDCISRHYDSPKNPAQHMSMVIHDAKEIVMTEFIELKHQTDETNIVER